MALTLPQFHCSLLGSEPTELQSRFYSLPGQGRGFDARDPDPDRFAASFVLALYLARSGQVILATPKPYEPKVIEQVNYWTRLIFRRFKGKTLAVKRTASAIKQLRIASRMLIQIEEPDRWVSIGLSKDDPIPSWLREKLI